MIRALGQCAPPNYSIIVPIYGKPDLAPLLHSLDRQSIAKEKFEIILVDDGTPVQSQCAFAEYQQSFSDLNIRVLQLPINRGPASARNAGVRTALGRLLFFTDDDCEVPADWLETHVQFHQKYPHVAVVGGWYGEPIKNLSKNLYQNFIHRLFQMYIRYDPVIDLYSFVGTSNDVPRVNLFPATNTANLSIKRGAFSAVGGFDERYPKPSFEDVDFTSRLRKSGFVLLYIPQIVLHRKPMTFFSYIRLLNNRAFGIYINTEIKNLSYLPWYRAYRDFVVVLDSSPSSKKDFIFFRYRIMFVAFLYYFYLYSGAGRWLMRLQWRRRIKKPT